MTQDDVLETFCPLFMTALIVRDGCVSIQSEDTVKCLGDLCMFWRWKSTDDANDDGYCGFVGKEGAQ